MGTKAGPRKTQGAKIVMAPAPIKSFGTPIGVSIIAESEFATCKAPTPILFSEVKIPKSAIFLK